MLVLTRRIGEEIVIDGAISVTVVAIREIKPASELMRPRLSAWTARKFMSAARHHARQSRGLRFPLASKE